jgi:hypothetical protein
MMRPLCLHNRASTTRVCRLPPVQGLSAAGERYVRGKDDLSLDLNNRLGKWSASLEYLTTDDRRPTTDDLWLLDTKC